MLPLGARMSTRFVPTVDIAAQLAAIVQYSRDAIMSTDLDGTITTWNQASEQIYGYSAGEAIGQSYRLIIPPERQAEDEDARNRVRSGQPVEYYETVRIRKDGTRIDVSVTISPLLDQQGKIVGVSKIARDITERRRAEDRFRLAIEAAPTAILIADQRGRITFANAHAEALFRYTRDELLERSVEDLVPERFRGHHPGYRKTFFAEPIRRPMGAGRDLYGLRKDGSEIPVEIGLSPFESGGHVFVLAAIADISERKRSSQQAAFLAEAGAILAGSLDYATTLKAVTNLAVPSIADWCAVDVMTDKGTLDRIAVAHVDPAKIELAGTIRARYEDPDSPYSPTYVVRTGASAIVPRVSDDMITAAAHGDEEQALLVRSLGLVSYLIVPLMAHGRTFGALTLATAESGRHYSNDDLRFAQDIAFRVALAVDNARAYQDADAANRLKDEFLATLSHELRTPLNAILGYARLLQSGMMSADRQSRALGTVERNATALTRIVGDILDVSRIISGKIRLNVQPIDLPQVVTDAVETLLPAAEAKQIRVQSILDPAAAPISGDPDRVQQIVWNLVSNAVKFTPKGGVVQVRLERVNSHVEIVVSDTGIGIAPDFLPYVFDRFRQADSRTTREHGGIGLGLAIVRSLVELHGGTIHAASGGRDRGTTFRVRLPLMAVHAEAPLERRRAQSGTAGDGVCQLPNLAGIQVLAVDDDADARELVRETLEGAGGKVTTIAFPSAALAEIERLRPNVLIADIGMPGTDGFELIAQVRESSNPLVRDVPAAALTAYARSEDRVKALTSGFQMHLTKPVDPAELIAVVATLARR